MDSAQIDRFVKHWVQSSDSVSVEMNHLVEAKDYSWALFVGHLVIEKLLKAVYIKNKSEHLFFYSRLVEVGSKVWFRINSKAIRLAGGNYPLQFESKI